MNAVLKTTTDRRGFLKTLGLGAAAVTLGSVTRIATAEASERFGLSPIRVRGNASRLGWHTASVEVFVAAKDREAAKAVQRARREISSGVADYVSNLSADELTRGSRSVHNGIANAVLRSAPRGTLLDVTVSRIEVYK